MITFMGEVYFPETPRSIIFVAKPPNQFRPALAEEHASAIDVPASSVDAGVFFDITITLPIVYSAPIEGALVKDLPCSRHKINIGNTVWIKDENSVAFRLFYPEVSERIKAPNVRRPLLGLNYTSLGALTIGYTIRGMVINY